MAFSAKSLPVETTETKPRVNAVLVHLLEIYTEKNGLVLKMKTFLNIVTPVL